MDEILLQRYFLLLYSYDSGNSDLIGDLKLHILKRGDLLRPDAALCLLTLFDQMIIRPYKGNIFNPNAKNVSPLPLPKVAGDHFDGSVWKSFETIISYLEKNGNKGPRSSHEVLIAINAVWKELSSFLGWG